MDRMEGDGRLDGGSGVLLAGCGNLGRALLTGWLQSGLPTSGIRVVDPAGLEAHVYPGVTTARAAHVFNEVASSLVLAVKPQMLDAAATDLAHLVGSETTVISVLAGRPLAAIREAFPQAGAVVRAMPNTAAAIGASASVLCAEPEASGAARALAERLLGAVGLVRWVGDECQMHAVTAVSGSGPAYFFRFIEVLARAGHAAGLPKDLSMDLAIQTALGAGRLAGLRGDPAALRRQVTSPNGTTLAGLEALEAGGLEDLIMLSVQAAAARSRELAE